MSERMKFVQHFIESNSQTAVKAMEELPTEVLSSLLEELDSSTALSALTSMLPFSASAGLQRVNSETAIKFLSSMNSGNAASILRCYPSSERTEVLRKLPRRQSTLISMTLNYSQQLVGAWMDADIQPLPLSATVAEARKRIANQSQNYNIAFTVNSDNSVHGSVSVVDLLQNPDENLQIATFADSEILPISASSRLRAAVNHESWGRSDVLPVVDRQTKLIGALRFMDLLRAINSQGDEKRTVTTQGDFLGFTEMCYAGLADVVSVTLTDKSHKDNESN